MAPMWGFRIGAPGGRFFDLYVDHRRGALAHGDRRSYALFFRKIVESPIDIIRGSGFAPGDTVSFPGSGIVVQSVDLRQLQ